MEKATVLEHDVGTHGNAHAKNVVGGIFVFDEVYALLPISKPIKILKMFR